MSLAKHVSIFFKADTKAFQSGLDKMSKSMTRFGRQTQKLGRSITRNFSIPFALAGGAAVKMVADFDTSLTKMRTLVGLSEQQVNQFKDSILELSGTTAQAPKELADGLFFLTSAGLKGANAMETLEQVSKGVAIGLGSQTDLAKIAGAAQNAYGKDVLSAAEALDTFGAMVKTGMFESSELAQVLGKEAGFAAALGISFEELGAFISTYTRTTGDATSATVGVSGVMLAFTKQTKKGEDALASINMTYGELKEMLGEQGLQKTLIHLKTAFEDNGIELSEFFGKSQSLKGVINVLGNQTGEYVNILDDLKDSTGFVNEGFGIVEETVGFKLQKAFNEFKLAMMDLGVALLPLATQLIEFVTKLSEKFQNLGPTAQKTIATLAAGFAISGPLLTGIGAVSIGIGRITKAFKLLAANPYLAAIGVAIAGVIALVNELKFATMGLKNATADANAETDTQITKFQTLVDIAKNEIYEVSRRQKAIDELNKSVKAYNGELSLSTIALTDHTKILKIEREELMKVAMLKSAQKEIQAVSDKLFDLNQKLADGPPKLLSFKTGIQFAARSLKRTRLKEQLEELTKITLDYNDANSDTETTNLAAANSFDDLSTSVNDATGEIQNFADTALDASHDVFDLAFQTDNLRVATLGLKDLKVDPFGGKTGDYTNFLKQFEKTQKSFQKTKKKTRTRPTGGDGDFQPEEQEFLELAPVGGIFDVFEEELRETYGATTDAMNEDTFFLLSGWEMALLKLDEMQLQLAESFSSGFGNAIADAIVEGESFGESMKNVFKGMLKQLIAAVAQALILKAIFQAFPGVEAALAIAGRVTGITSANDIAFGPSAGRFITGPEGTFSLNQNDSIVAGTDLFKNQGSGNMTVNGYIDGSTIFLSNTRQTNTVNRLS